MRYEPYRQLMGLSPLSSAMAKQTKSPPQVKMSKVIDVHGKVEPELVPQKVSLVDRAIEMGKGVKESWKQTKETAIGKEEDKLADKKKKQRQERQGKYEMDRRQELEYERRSREYEQTSRR